MSLGGVWPDGTLSVSALIFFFIFTGSVLYSLYESLEFRFALPSLLFGILGAGFAHQGYQHLVVLLGQVAATYSAPPFLNWLPYHAHLISVFVRFAFEPSTLVAVLAYPVFLLAGFLALRNYVGIHFSGSLRARRLAEFGIAVGIAPLCFGLNILSKVLGIVIRRLAKPKSDLQLKSGVPVFSDELEGLRELRKSLSSSHCDGIEIHQGLKIPFFLESLNFIFGGGMGSGKTQFFFRILAQTRARGDRNVILDTKGDFSQVYGEEPDTILLGITDARSVPWDVAADVTHELEAIEFAEMLISGSDSGGGEHAGFFTEAARDCVTGALLACIRTKGKRWTFSDVCEILNDKSQLISALQTYRPAALQLIEERENQVGGAQAAGVFGNIRARTKHLDFFVKAWPNPVGGLSLKRWVREEGYQGKKTLVVQRDPRYEVLTSFLVSQAVEIVFKELLSLDDSHTRRVNIFLDEISVYRRLPSLIEAVKTSRSKGFPIYASVQEVAALDAIYRSSGGAEEILNGFANKFVGKQSSSGAAEHWVKSFGVNCYDKKVRTKSRSEGRTTTTESVQEVRQTALTTGMLLGLPASSLTVPAEMFVGLAGCPIVKMSFPNVKIDSKYPRTVVPGWLLAMEAPGVPLARIEPTSEVESDPQDDSQDAASVIVDFPV